MDTLTVALAWVACLSMAAAIVMDLLPRASVAARRRVVHRWLGDRRCDV